MLAPINALPRAAVLALAIPLALLLAWRVLVAGTGALAERNLEMGGPVAGAPPDAAAAEAQMRQRLARNPADATAILLLAIELERQGKRDEADAAMRTAVRLAPADPPTLLLVAGYFLRTGEEAQALTALRRAVDSSQAVVGDRTIAKGEITVRIGWRDGREVEQRLALDMELVRRDGRVVIARLSQQPKN